MCFLNSLASQVNIQQDSHWSPLESIGVKDLTCMLVESIGVGDLVELMEFVPKKDLH